MVKKPSAGDAPALISNDKLKQIYSTMQKCRILDTQARKVAHGLLSSKGHEAALVGTAIDLLTGDTLLFENSAIAEFLQKSRLRTLFENLPKPSASKRKREPRALALNAEAHVSIATGVALANHSNESSNIIVVFFNSSDALTASARLSLALAAIQKLPVIYVSLGPAHVEDTARSYGFPAIPVDGNDAVAVYRVAHECITRARQGAGPSLIECKTFLMEDGKAKHTKPSRNPLGHMEQYLKTKGIFTETWKQNLIRTFEKEVKHAMSVARRKSAKAGTSSKAVPLLHVR
jgi:TPP-dependent pyruvate/acetoin dehydrogenase alpha subunit